MMIDGPRGWKDHKFFIDLFVVVFLLVMLMNLILTAGCVTAAKNTYAELTATPVPTPTTPPPTPEPTPTPEPIPTLNPYQQLVADGGYMIGEWHQWYREDVDGLKDMVVRATVYDVKFMPSFHWRDFLWGSHSTRLNKPEAGMKYMFVFVRTENIGTARTWGWDKSHFYINYNATLYFPIDDWAPELYIKELDNTFTRGREENVPPYGYKRVQDLSTGIITAEPLAYLREGASNYWDGYIVFEVPRSAELTHMQIIGNFDNVGGQVYWVQLPEGIAEGGL